MILVSPKWPFKRVSISGLVPAKRNDNPRATCREAGISLAVSQKRFNKTAPTSVCFLRGPFTAVPLLFGWFVFFVCFFAPAGLARASPSLLTPQVGRPLVAYHARGQRAVVRRGAAEQDVVGHGLVQHGAVRAGVRTLTVAAHALVRERPVQGAPRRQRALRGREKGNNLSGDGSRKCQMFKLTGVPIPPCALPFLCTAGSHVRAAGRVRRVCQGT